MKKNDQHDIEELQELYAKISQNRQSPDNEVFPERLNQLGKLLVWGDRQNSDFFDYFCEVKALDLILDIFGKGKTKEVVIGIIGFFNMLFTNLNRQQSINYLLSHPCIISMQMAKFGNMLNEVAEYYINFLKGLSRKMTLNTLHLFHNKKSPGFPILMQTARFYNHPENLVRTTCRNILLSIAKLKHSKISDFIEGFPFITYFLHESDFIRQHWLIIDDIIDSEEDRSFQISNLDSIIQDHQQIIIYLDDMMTFSSQTLINRIIDAFSNQCLAPLVQTLSSPKKLHFSLKLAVFVSAVLLKAVSKKEFIEAVVLILFGRYYSRQLSLKILHPQQKLLSYCKQWKFKGFWDSHQDKINQHCILKYHKQKVIISDIKAKHESTISKKMNHSVDSVFGVNTNFYQRQIQKLESIFGIPINTPSQFFKKKSMSQILKQLKQAAKEGLNLQKCQENPVRKNIISLLSSKDDTLVVLTVNLLLSVLNHKSINQEILDFCGLSIKPKNRDFQSIMSIQIILINCVGIFEVDPPSFRICTYKLTAQLIKILSKLYNKQHKISIDIYTKMKNAVKTTIQRINPYIYSGKDWQKIVQIFNRVSQNDKKNQLKTLKVYGLIPFDQIIDKKNKKKQNIYQQFPKTAQQQIIRDLWLYIIVRDLFYLLFWEQQKQISIDYDDNNQSLYQTGKQYNVQIDPGSLIICNIKQLETQRSFQGEIIFLGGYIITLNNKIVQYKCSYKDAAITADHSDPRKVLLVLEGSALSIALSDAKTAYQFRYHFEEMKKTMLKYQLSQIVKQIQGVLLLTV